MTDFRASAPEPDPLIAGFPASYLRSEVDFVGDRLHSWPIAHDVVIRALARYPHAERAIADNRRLRYTPKHGRREPYRTITDSHGLLRLLVLDELELIERAEERTRANIDGLTLLARYVQRLSKDVLATNSFYAAVGMGQVLTKFKSTELLDMFNVVDPDRAATKDSSACTKAKHFLFTSLVNRFDGRLNVEPDAPCQPVLRPATPQEVYVVTKVLNTCLPVPVTAGVSDLDNMRFLLVPATFVKLVGEVQHRVDERVFEKRLRVPTFSGDSGVPTGEDPMDPQGGVPYFDPNYLSSAVSELARRRSRIAPGSLRLSVDGVDMIIEAGWPSEGIPLKPGASIVRLVATDCDDVPITIATCILGDPSEERAHWSVELPTDQTVSCEFTRLADGRLMVSLQVQTTEPAMRPALIHAGKPPDRNVHDPRTESLHLLELLKDMNRPVAERFEIFGDLLALECGFWQTSTHSRPVTLKGFVVHVVRWLLGRPYGQDVRADAIDDEGLVEDALFLLFQKAHTIRIKPRAWLIGSIRRMVYNTIRDGRVLFFASEIDDVKESTLQMWWVPRRVDAKRTLRLRRAIHHLRPTERRVMDLYCQGYSMREIASTIGKSERAVRRVYERSVRQLREELTALIRESS